MNILQALSEQTKAAFIATDSQSFYEDMIQSKKELLKSKLSWVNKDSGAQFKYSDFAKELIETAGQQAFDIALTIEALNRLQNEESK